MIFFKRNKDIHFDIYYKIVNISRDTNFYSKCKVPDTTDGKVRDSIITSHHFDTKIEKDRKEYLSQSIVDLMFSSIDLIQGRGCW